MNENLTENFMHALLEIGVQACVTRDFLIERGLVTKEEVEKREQWLFDVSRRDFFNRLLDPDILRYRDEK